jgi:uncharacterized protein
MAHLTVPRSTIRDTWRWLWPDVFIRLLPFWAIALVVAHYLGGLPAVGLTAPPQGWFAALAIGLAGGCCMSICAFIWRRRIAPRYRLPTLGDQTLQTFFYLIMNAPTEEVFWRGVVQTLAIRGLIATHLSASLATIIGVLLVSIIFGAYHRLGGYGWNFNIAAMAAGMVFGFSYVGLPGPSIVVPTIIHGMTTAAYLSWGDAMLHLRSRQSKMKT